MMGSNCRRASRRARDPALKKKKTVEQNGLCNICHEPLPAKFAVLDRFEAAGGYTLENTQLLCPSCDSQKQRDLGYT
jgi:rubrerythrin